MFARVTIMKVRVDKRDEVIKITQDSVIPAAKTQKGFRGLYSLGDSKTGRGITISLWDTEEDAVANEQSGYYQEQTAKFTSYFTEAPVREGYEVLAQG